MNLVFKAYIVCRVFNSKNFLKKFYPEYEALVGKKIAFIANLKPRKMLGHESQGMLLSSEKDGKVKLAIVGDEHEVGAELG